MPSCVGRERWGRENILKGIKQGPPTIRVTVLACLPSERGGRERQEVQPSFGHIRLKMEGVVSILALTLVVGNAAGVGGEPTVAGIVAGSSQIAVASGVVIGDRHVLTAASVPEASSYSNYCAMRVFVEGRIFRVANVQDNGRLAVLYLDQDVPAFEEPELTYECEDSVDNRATLSWMDSKRYLNKVGVRSTNSCTSSGTIVADGSYICGQVIEEFCVNRNVTDISQRGGPITCQDGRIVGITSRSYRGQDPIFVAFTEDDEDFLSSLDIGTEPPPNSRRRK